MLITIDNNKYKLNFQALKNSKNFTILQVCEFFNINIPKFCYHEKLNVAGNCRMCLVEIEKAPKPIVACATPITPNMNIFTNTPLVKKARENVLELLLINHPLDCPICDQGGECDLQDNTKDFASDRNRNFTYHRRVVEDKLTGPIIKTIMTRCIHCTRCVRFMEEIADNNVLRSFGRGTSTEIGTFVDRFLKTEFSGNLADICPVGALTSKPYAFSARSWELRKVKTVDNSDALGSLISVYSRSDTTPSNTQNFFQNYKKKDKIMRILPFYNEENNEMWISDKTRFAFDGLYTNRVVKPTLIKNFKKVLLKQKLKQFNWFNFYKTNLFNFDKNFSSKIFQEKKKLLK